MKKQISTLITISLLCTILTGCWNRRELNNIAITFALGYDTTKDGDYMLTTQILSPGQSKQKYSGGQDSTAQGVFTVISKGLTPFESSRNASRQSARRLYIAHNKIIVIGEETARSGIFPILDHWYRDIEGQPLTNILIAKDKASEIIEAGSPVEKIPGLAIEELIKTSYATSRVGTVTLYEIMKTITSKTNGSYAAGIETVQYKNEKITKLNRTAIFKKDKLVVWFGDKESRGLLWILAKVKGGSITVSSPEDDTKEIGLKIIRESTKVTPTIIDGKPIINVKIKEEGIIAVQGDPKLDLNKPDTLKKLENEKAKAIKDEVNSALEKAQKQLNVDVFKFGEAFHRKYPREWKALEKNWDEEFKKLQVKVDVEAKIRRLGLNTSYDED